MKLKIIIPFFLLFLLFSSKPAKAQYCCRFFGVPFNVPCLGAVATICTSFGFTYQAFACNVPVELISFSGEAALNGVSLKWVTATEINNDRFELERSIDATNWELIGVVAGNGNSSQLLNYSYFDEYPHVGTNYYRLKQIDFDGAFKYEGGIVTVEYKVDKVKILPNLVQEEFTLQFPTEFNQNKKIEIYNMNQQLVRTILLSDNSYEYNVNITDLSSGFYLLSIITENNRIVKKFAKQ